MLGAILLDNDAINQALEILTAGRFLPRSASRHLPRDGRAYRPQSAGRRDHAYRRAAHQGHARRDRRARLISLSSRSACRPRPTSPIMRGSCARRRCCAAWLRSRPQSPAPPTTAQPNVDEFLDEAEHRVFEISERRIKPSFHSMQELTRDSLKLIERLYERQELVTGVPTGFTDFDRITAGLQPSDLIIIAARPSMGKTALALNIAALRRDGGRASVGVAFFSLEMSKEQLVLRLLARRRASIAPRPAPALSVSATFPSWRKRRRA